MPPPHYHDRHLHSHGGASAPKPDQKVLYIILKAIIMTFITTLFFLFLGVAAILLLLATAALHRHRSSSSSSSSSSSAVPSSSSNGFRQKDLKKLSQFRFSKRTRLDADTECVVCLEVIRQGQSCRRLAGCGHVFHKRCVDAWLVKVATCPICRTRVRLDLGALLEDRPFWGFGCRSDLRVW